MIRRIYFVNLKKVMLLFVSLVTGAFTMMATESNRTTAWTPLSPVVNSVELVKKPAAELAKPVYADTASPDTQVVIPFTSIIGGTDATNNAKNNPHGGYFSHLDNIKQYGYPFPQYHKNQLGDTALGNDGVFYDTKPGGLDQTHVPALDPGGGKANWWALQGEWVSYELNVAVGGTYTIMTRFSTAWGAAKPVIVHMTVDDVSSGPFPLKADDEKLLTDVKYRAGGWWGHTMVNCTSPVGWTLAPGRHVFKFFVDERPDPATSATRYEVWIHYFKVAKAGTPVGIAPDYAPAAAATTAPVKVSQTTTNFPPMTAKGIHIKAGGSAPFTDTIGNLWIADRGFTGGDTIARPDIKISSTQDPEIYRAEHYAMNSFSWPLTNGKYLVKLHFAETFDGITGPGQRVFSFNVQGHEFKDFDVWAKAGGPFKAYVETVPVDISDGRLAITFTSNVENPQINGIEILPLNGSVATISNQTNTPSPTVVPDWGAGKHVLLVGGGMYHDFPKWFNETDSAMLRDAGFAVRYSTDADTAAKWLPEADVLVFSACVGWHITPAFKAAYEKHRAAGKGIVGLHTGLWISWPNWPEVNRSFGLAAKSHPPLFQFTVQKIVLDHPLSSAIPDQITLQDELYSVQPFPDGAPVKVLAETSVSPQTHQKHPSFWVVDEPGVRVACIAPGHDGRTHTNENFKKWLIETVRWATQPAAQSK